MWRDIYELLKVEEQNGELSGNERKRLRIFKEKKAKLDAMSQRPCKICGKMIPVAIVFCSSKCKEINKRRQKSLYNYTYTFSGWLRLVKNLSDKEIHDLYDDQEKCGKLQQEYNEYMTVEDKRLAELEEKAVRRKKKGRRYSGKYTGRGKFEERDF